MALKDLFEKNKRAQSGQKEIYYVFIVIFTLVGLFAIFIWLISSYGLGSVKVADGFERELAIQKFINHPECFAYQNPNTGRLMPGVIDPDKFKSNLDYCQKIPKDALAFRLTLPGMDPVKTYNFKDDSAFEKEYRYVLVRHREDVRLSRLEIEVQNDKD